jgi:hypothetical protein
MVAERGTPVAQPRLRGGVTDFRFYVVVVPVGSGRRAGRSSGPGSRFAGYWHEVGNRDVVNPHKCGVPPGTMAESKEGRVDLDQMATGWPFLIAATPGIAYAGTRAYARGIANAQTSIASRIGEGLVAAIVFDLVYILLFGNWLIDTLGIAGLQADPRGAALAVLAFGLAIPAVVAWTLHRGHLWKTPTKGVLPPLLNRGRKARTTIAGWTAYTGRVVRRFSSIPRAWDYALPDRGGTFVRIETAGGKFLGGYFAENSFFSTYPEPQDIFVELQYRMSSTGEFGDPVKDSLGFWYMFAPGDTIEWVAQPAPVRPIEEESHE